MANKNVFGSTQVVNHAGGKAHLKSSEQILASLACTGAFNNTFYAAGKDQLDLVTEHAKNVSDDYLAKLAVYARQKGFMKDMPALLCAMLVARQSTLADVVFDKVIDNARMLRNFVQILRSGAVGRKSLGSKAKRLVKRFIGNLNDYSLWEASVGRDPSLVDVLKLAHPKAKDENRNALYAYIMGKPVDVALLPDFIRDYEAFVAGESKYAPVKAPFQKLTALPLSTHDWERIASNARWTATRMNLNTFHRHGVFDNKEMVDVVAARLSDRENIIKARAFPYQLMTAMLNVSNELPHKLKVALEDAMEVALENVPEIAGKTVIAIDVSGSMSSAITGNQGSATSKVTCLDVAALVGAALMHKNRSANIVTFAYETTPLRVAHDAKVMTIANTIKRNLGGGTNCGSVINYLIKNNIEVDQLVMVSDNESWADNYRSDLSTLWARYKGMFPKAKMVNCDITPNQYSVSANRADTLMVGGFSDEVFNVMASFFEGRTNQVDAIKAVSLD